MGQKKKKSFWLCCCGKDLTGSHPSGLGLPFWPLWNISTFIFFHRNLWVFGAVPHWVTKQHTVPQQFFQDKENSIKPTCVFTISTSFPWFKEEKEKTKTEATFLHWGVPDFIIKDKKNKNNKKVELGSTIFSHWSQSSLIQLQTQLHGPPFWVWCSQEEEDRTGKKEEMLEKKGHLQRKKSEGEKLFRLDIKGKHWEVASLGQC